MGFRRILKNSYKIELTSSKILLPFQALFGTKWATGGQRGQRLFFGFALLGVEVIAEIFGAFLDILLGKVGIDLVHEIQRTLPKTEAEISEEQVAQADRDLEAEAQFSLRNDIVDVNGKEYKKQKILPLNENFKGSIFWELF